MVAHQCFEAIGWVQAGLILHFSCECRDPSPYPEPMRLSIWPWLDRSSSNEPLKIYTLAISYTVPIA